MLMPDLEKPWNKNTGFLNMTKVKSSSTEEIFDNIGYNINSRHKIFHLS